MSLDTFDRAVAQGEAMAAVLYGGPIAVVPDPLPAAEPVGVILDDDTLAYLDPDTGEIVGVQDAPPETADVRDVGGYLGPRRAAALAKAEGLEAEKAAWIKRINEQYDPQIKRQRNLVAYLEGRYRDLLRDFAAHSLVGKGRKSLTVGLLTLKFVKARPKLDVIDEPTAVQWAKLACPAAVKVKESLLTSQIPDELRADLSPDSTGLRFDPGGYDVFKVE